MKVSLISTVKDIGPEHVREFLDSLAAQTRPPDETIIVDGGSTDGTLEAFEEAGGLTVISEPGANISRGRNVAIGAAAHEVIAATDADCTLDPHWLERLIAPIEAGADVSAGFYVPRGDSFLQVCMAAVSLREPEEIGPGWMPSSRSIAFRRTAYEAAGGYPEWLEVGEDMYFDHRLVSSGARMDNATDAVVHWRIRPTLGETWTQYAGYAEGDALAGMYPERHFIRFAAYGFAAWAITRNSRLPTLLAAAAGTAYAARQVRRGWRRLADRPNERAASTVAVPAAMAFVDLAKMWGYARGLTRRIVEEVFYD
jgi:glycosyltransferase involved in cell wall biosynthesis